MFVNYNMARIARAVREAQCSPTPPIYRGRACCPSSSASQAYGLPAEDSQRLGGKPAGEQRRMHRLRPGLPRRPPCGSGDAPPTRAPAQVRQAVAPGDGGKDALPHGQGSRHGLHALPGRRAQVEAVFPLRPLPLARREQLVHGSHEVVVVVKR